MTFSLAGRLTRYRLPKLFQDVAVSLFPEARRLINSVLEEILLDQEWKITFDSWVWCPTASNLGGIRGGERV